MRITTSLFALMLSLTGAAGTASAQSFSYDAAGRLVRAVYPAGGGVGYQYDGADNIVAVLPLNVPATPAGIQISRIDPTSVRISWDATPGATGYQIERQAVGSSKWDLVVSTSANQQTYVDATLQANQDYLYRVAPVGADGTGAYTAAASTADAGSTLPMISQIVNGASFSDTQPIAPGSIVSIFGVNFGYTEQNGEKNLVFEPAGNPPLPIELASHSVMIGGRPAPMFFVSGRMENGQIQAQINVQVPWQTTPGDAVPVVVRRRNGSTVYESDVAMVSVAPVSPAIFTFEYGGGPAAVVNIKLSQDDDVINGSISQPSGSLPGASTQPAARGGIIAIYTTGLGEVNPVARDGETSLDAIRKTVLDPVVLIDGIPAKVYFSGLAPEFVGLYQINVEVPQGASVGEAIPVQIQIGGAMSRDDTTIAVRP